MQKFRHDYLNILVSLRGYIDNNDMDSLKTYFYENIVPTEQQTIFRNKMIGMLENIEMMGVKSILASKIMQANRFNIEVNIEIPNIIEKINMNTVDLTRVIGIYLDNAIEASIDLPNSRINIAFFKIENKAVLLIIENRVNMAVNLNEIFMQGNSTKGDRRGIGLVNARTILSQYKQITMSTRINKDWFIEELQIEEES